MRFDDGRGDVLQRYLDEIGAHHLLDPSEEERLGATLVDGRVAEQELRASTPSTEREVELRKRSTAAAAARERLLQANLGLVVPVAKQYQDSGVPLLDLVQEGNLGLLRAVERFDPSRDDSFTAKAEWSIRQAISRAVGLHQRPPAVLTDVAPSPAAIGHVIEDDNPDPYDAAADALEQDTLRRQLARLHPREQAVLRRRFGFDDPTSEGNDGGDEARASRGRGRLVEARALGKLRHPCLAAAWSGPTA